MANVAAGRGKTVIITGGNSGIGFVTARALLERGWRVVVTGRDAGKLGAAVAALGSAVGGEAAYRVGDFASFASVRALARELEEEPRIDVLFNNAGIALSLRQVSEDGNEMMLQVNHLSPFLLTHLLLDRLKASAPARILNVSSRAHRGATGYGFEDFQFERSYSTGEAYARTKLYNILFTRELARRLTGTGVTVNALHPGAVRTNIGMEGDLIGGARLVFGFLRRFMSPLEAGSKVTVFGATAPELASVTGKYLVPSLREELPSRLALDDAAAGRLWETSRRITGAGGAA